jgi:hypothetical protein
VNIPHQIKKIYADEQTEVKQTESDDEGGIEDLLNVVEGQINYKREETNQNKFFTLEHRETIELF